MIMAPAPLTRPRPSRVRRFAVLALIAALLAGVIGAVTWQWRSRSGLPEPAAALSNSARQLAAMPGLRLAVEYTSGAGVRTTGTFTVTRENEVLGILDDPGGGHAELRAGTKGTIVKGDEAWWGRRDPYRVRALVGQWVQPLPGLFDAEIAGLLRPDRIAAIQRGAIQADARTFHLGRVDGHEQFVVVTRDWTFRLAEGSPPRLLEFAGSVGRATPTPTPPSSPSKSASVKAPATTSTKGRGGGLMTGPVTGVGTRFPLPPRPSAPGGGAAVFNPFAATKVQPATPTQLQRARQAVSQGRPIPSAETTSRAPGQLAVPKSTKVVSQVKAPTPARLEPQVTSSRHCGIAPTCHHTAVVTNHGARTSAPADATMSTTVGGYSFTSIPPLPPGASSSISVSHPNPEASSGRVSHALLFISIRQGGLDPEQQVVDRVTKRLGTAVMYRPAIAKLDAPYKARAYQALDKMTEHIQTDQRGEEDPLQRKDVSETLAGLKFASDNHLLPDVVKLATSPGLKNKQDLSSKLYAMKQAFDQGHITYTSLLREFQDVLYQIEQNPNAQVYYDGTYKHSDDKDYKLDRLLIDGARKEAVQTKSIHSANNFRRRLAAAIDQLNHGRGANQDGVAEGAPPGFTKIVLLYIENPHGEAGAGSSEQTDKNRRRTREEFKKYLKKLQNAKDMYCKKDGDSRVDKFIIVNNTGVHEIPFAELGVKC